MLLSSDGTAESNTVQGRARAGAPNGKTLGGLGTALRWLYTWTAIPSMWHYLSSVRVGSHIHNLGGE